jgi:hypothetical protein
MVGFTIKTIKVLCSSLARTFVFYWFGWAIGSFVDMDLGVHVFDAGRKDIRLFLCVIFVIFCIFISFAIFIDEN